MRLLQLVSTRTAASGTATRAAAFAFVAALSLAPLASVRPVNASGPSGSVAFIGEDGGVYSASLVGGAAKELWTPSGQSMASEPQWAPDAGAVAFIGADGNVWKVSAAGGDAHALTQQATPPSGCNDEICQNQGVRADSPRWSPDGKTISYRLVDDAAKASIWTVSAAGGTPTQLTSANGLCLFNEGFTPTGTPLFSRCAQSNGSTNATYESASSGPSQLLSGSQIAYAPTGNRLAYAQQTQSSTSVSVALYVAAADGSGASLVAQGGQDPAWSHSGLLAYQKNTPNGREIHVFDPTGNRDAAVANGMLAGWSADGGWLVYSTTDNNGNSQIMRVQPDGTGATMVAQGDFPAVSAV